MCPFCNIILAYHSVGEIGSKDKPFDEFYDCPQCNGMFEIEEVEGWGHGV